jgi:hypothetical protein
VAVRRKTSEATFRVVWIGTPKTSCEGQIGVECIDPDKSIWDIDFADAHEDFEPISETSVAQTSRTKTSTFPCSGTARIWIAESADTSLEAKLTAIGLLGAEIEGEELPLNEVVFLQFQVEEAKLTLTGVIGTQDHASMKAVKFSRIRRGDRAILQHLVSKLSIPRGL